MHMKWNEELWLKPFNPTLVKWGVHTLTEVYTNSVEKHELNSLHHQLNNPSSLLPTTIFSHFSLNIAAWDIKFWGTVLACFLTALQCHLPKFSPYSRRTTSTLSIKCPKFSKRNDKMDAPWVLHVEHVYRNGGLALRVHLPHGVDSS